MRKEIAYAVLLFLALAGLIAWSYIPFNAPAEKSPEQKAYALCASFADSAGCEETVKRWQTSVRSGEVYAVVDYLNDGKSAFAEGWILYIRLNGTMPAPGTNKSVSRIGMLFDKNSNSSQIYEFVG